MISPSSWLLALARRPLLFLMLLLRLLLPVAPLVAQCVYLPHLIPRQAFAAIKYILPAADPLVGGMNPKNQTRISVLEMSSKMWQPRHWHRFTTAMTRPIRMSHLFQMRWRHFNMGVVSTRQVPSCGISTS